MCVHPGSFDPEDVLHLTASSRAVGLLEGSRQPSGKNIVSNVRISVASGPSARTVPTGPHYDLE